MAKRGRPAKVTDELRNKYPGMSNRNLLNMYYAELFLCILEKKRGFFAEALYNYFCKRTVLAAELGRLTEKNAQKKPPKWMPGYVHDYALRIYENEIPTRQALKYIKNGFQI